MSAAPNVLVFDSGIGGLSVLKELRRALPGAAFTYVADDAAFPYGEWDEAHLHDRIVELIGRLIEAHRPALVVIACNTASTLVLPALREHYGVPIIGTVPAIKPAAEQTRSGLISVLATPGTMARDYTRELIRSFASACEVRLVGSSALAPLAEAYVRGEPIGDETVGREILPAFVEKDGRRTDVIVLACTHYPFLLEIFQRLAPWQVVWIDPAPAIARHAASVLGGASGPRLQGKAILTSGRAWPPTLAGLLAGLGLSPDG